jgi:phosphatidylinositol-bisphosphatase
MSAYDKRRIFRVYTYGKSYILASQLIEHEKLQIKALDSTISLNKISADEWSLMTSSKTNSVKSPSFGMAFDAYGCLGMLSISTQQLQQQQTPQQQQQQPQSQFYNQSPPKEDSAAMLHYLIFVKEVISVGTIKKFDIMKISDVTVLPLNADSNPQLNYLNQTYMNYINEIKKFLSSGVFYFSYSSEANAYFDLTLSSQARYLAHHSNKKFLWNFNLHLPFRRFNVDTNQWLLKLICGCIEIKKIITLSRVFKACIFSRLSCDRVGTRFNCRGVNDEGNCANFVETEQVVYSTETDEESSFLQLRGSVPVFFEQSGLQVGSHKIKISRSTHACYPAFERHIKSLIQDYGSCLFVLNLLGIKGDESILTNFFYYLCQISPYSMRQQLSYTNFDYHQELKINKQALGEKLWPHLTQVFYRDNHANNSTDGMFFSLKSSEASENGAVAKLQQKYIRTNCMDCLDRTNSVQAYVGIEMLRYQLAGFVSESEVSKFREVFRQMWIINGDCISKIYAGTGAIQGKSVTQDISRSLSRAIQNNFLDYTKQDAIETFLYSMSRNYGELADRVKVLMSQTFLRLPYSILREVVTAKKQYTHRNKCKIVMGTWNINGGLNKFDMDELDLSDWLIDGPLTARKAGFGYLDASVQTASLADVDVFAIGFEEIVDLNAQNIVSASDENATIWYNKIIECLRKHGDYVQLIAENLQLVGVCLFVFVLKKHVGYIRDVCISKTKTGFGGAAGNKGGVLLRFIYYNTSMCFVCSHFAAHQKEIRQRNEDFRQIYETSEFTGQAVTTTSKIETKFHDYVFWCGDLNYRIDLANDYCRTLIAQRDWDTLLRAEQLCLQRNEQNVFREFEEAPVLFPPTYKYNLNEDTYDRSEKCRVPAWTGMGFLVFSFIIGLALLSFE